MASPRQLPVGREDVVRRAIDALSGPGRRTAVVIVGEAGIGKSTVLAAVAEELQPRLGTRASEMSQGLAYCALADLVGDHVRRIGSQLAPARREALLGALRLAGADRQVPDVQTVAFAAADLLAAMPAKGPIIVAIDDAQWLDRESAICLEYAIHRLAGRGIAWLVTQRAGPSERPPLGLDEADDDVAVLRLGPLAAGALGRLLDQHLGRALPRPTLLRVHELSRGNPLLALELARLLPPSAAADALPESPDVSRLIGGRVQDLQPATIDLLVLAAAASRPTVDLLARATGLPDARVAARLGPRATDGLVEIVEGVIRFGHPLHAAGARQAVSPGALAGAHARLAAVTVGADRAFHLVAAASGPDERLAAEVEQVALAAAQEGTASTAAILLEHAAQLSAEPLEGGRRRLLASEWHRAAGDASRADRLARQVIDELPPGGPRARARAALFTPAVSDDELAAATRDAEGDDGALAFVYDRHVEAAFLGLRLTASVQSSRAAIEAAERAGDAGVLSRVLAAGALTLGLLEPGGGRPWLERAAGIEAAPKGPASWVVMLAGLQMCADQLDEARAGFRSAADSCREAGDEQGRAGCLLHLAGVETRAGDLRAARAVVDEHAELSAGLGSWQDPYLVDYVQSLVLAYEGMGDQAIAKARRGLAAAQAASDWGFALYLRHVVGLGHLSNGEFGPASDLLSIARRTMDDAGIAEVGVVPLHADEIEACIGCGRLDEALEACRRLEEVAQRLGRPRLIGGALVSRGLCLAATGSPEEGVDRIDHGIHVLAGAGFRWEQARALLALGGVLRRDRQRGRARTVLVEAERRFEDLGAPGWAARARAEAARVSGRARGSDELTPTEQRIAQLVATGLTNREIAANLFMSQKTVEGHLAHVFLKLGVRRRAELAARYAGDR